MPGPSAKPCVNPFEATDTSQYLPAGLTKKSYAPMRFCCLVLNVTTDQVTIPPIEMDVAKVTWYLSYMKHPRMVLSAPHENACWIFKPS